MDGVSDFTLRFGFVMLWATLLMIAQTHASCYTVKHTTQWHTSVHGRRYTQNRVKHMGVVRSVGWL